MPLQQLTKVVAQQALLLCVGLVFASTLPLVTLLLLPAAGASLLIAVIGSKTLKTGFEVNQNASKKGS